MTTLVLLALAALILYQARELDAIRDAALRRFAADDRRP